jgi:hypothetical protein
MTFATETGYVMVEAYAFVPMLVRDDRIRHRLSMSVLVRLRLSHSHSASVPSVCQCQLAIACCAWHYAFDTLKTAFLASLHITYIKLTQMMALHKYGFPHRITLAG